ncbi:MAG TPA: RNA polymerase sigma factor [Cellvibrio sp.]|nr:RNA polymerase sigma factor [Cellvibrio sp.]
MKGAQLLVSLFESHYSELRSLISYKFKKNYHDADDIVQDAFHNILRAENIEAIENPKAYLYQAASNLALNRIRKQKRHHEYIAALDAEETNDLTPERNVFAHKDLHRLEQALAGLPQKYRTTFLLSRMQDKTYKEISQTLGIPESTVEKHIIKVLKYLRTHLLEESGQ